jgi:hypothetical protein
MPDDPGYCEVHFMPWAGLTQELSIGPVRLRPWSPDRIRDEAIADHLTRYFRCYVDDHGVPVDSITFVSIGDDEVKPLPDEHTREVRNAIDALVFATICPSVNTAVCRDDWSMAPPAADRYQLISQAFQPANEYIAVRSGGNKSLRRIDEARFSRPWGLGGSFGFPDTHLLTGLGTLLSPDGLAVPRERIFRSLEWFRLAHTEGDNASPLTKLALQCTAFEILFALDERSKTKQFIEAVEGVVSSTDSPRDGKADHWGKPRNYSVPGWWAHDFYDLRSRILHGDAIDLATTKYTGWITHGIVADLVYWQCVVAELYELKYIGESIRELAKEWDAAFPDEEPGTSEPLLADWFLGFKRYQRALGWLSTSK